MGTELKAAIQRWDVHKGEIMLSIAIADLKTGDLTFSDIPLTERQLIKMARALLRDQDRSQLEERLQQMLF